MSDLKKCAAEMIGVMGLAENDGKGGKKQPIDVAKATEKELVGFVQKAAGHIEPSDTFSKETVATLQQLKLLPEKKAKALAPVNAPKDAKAPAKGKVLAKAKVEKPAGKIFQTTLINQAIGNKTDVSLADLVAKTKLGLGRIQAHLSWMCRQGWKGTVKD